MEAPSPLLHTLSVSDHNSRRDHGRHINMLDYSSIEHSYRHKSSTTFLLQIIETLKDNTFPAGEPIFHIREIITRVMSMHGRSSVVEQSAQEAPAIFATVPKQLSGTRGHRHTAPSPGSSTGLRPTVALLRSHHRFYHVWVELRQIQYAHPFRSHDHTRHRGKCLTKLGNPRLSSLLASIPFCTQLIRGHTPIDRLDLHGPSDW